MFFESAPTLVIYISTMAFTLLMGVMTYQLEGNPLGQGRASTFQAIGALVISGLLYGFTLTLITGFDTYGFLAITALSVLAMYIGGIRTGEHPLHLTGLSVIMGIVYVSYAVVYLITFAEGWVGLLLALCSLILPVKLWFHRGESRPSH